MPHDLKCLKAFWSKKVSVALNCSKFSVEVENEMKVFIFVTFLICSHSFASEYSYYAPPLPVPQGGCKDICPKTAVSENATVKLYYFHKIFF